MLNLLSHVSSHLNNGSKCSRSARNVNNDLGNDKSKCSYYGWLKHANAHRLLTKYFK